MPEKRAPCHRKRKFPPTSSRDSWRFPRDPEIPIGGEAMTAPSELTDSRSSRAGALSGVLFAAVFVISLVVVGVLGAGPPPSPWASKAAFEDFASGIGDAAPAASMLQAVSALALLVFVPYVVGYVRRNADDDALARLTQVAGTLAVAFLLFSALTTWVVGRPNTMESLQVTRAFQDLAWVTGAAGHVVPLGVFVGVASLVAQRTKTLPSWLAWLGLVSGAASVLSVLSVLGAALTPLLPLGRFTGFVWIVAVSIVLARAAAPVAAGSYGR